MQAILVPIRIKTLYSTTQLSIGEEWELRHELISGPSQLTKYANV